MRQINCNHDTITPRYFAIGLEVRTVRQKKSKYPPHTRPPVFKPGSYGEYLHQHPEVADEGLRKMGLELDEIDKLLMEG